MLSMNVQPVCELQHPAYSFLSSPNFYLPGLKMPGQPERINEFSLYSEKAAK